MFRKAKKFVAVLMLLWLPLFSSSALATSVSMLMQQADCHEASASQAMTYEDMAEHHQHHGEMAAAADEQAPSCNACGVCHLACTGYLAVPVVELVAAQTVARDSTPYSVSFISVSSAPLDPPPLARV
jgi:ferredoxin